MNTAKKPTGRPRIDISGTFVPTRSKQPPRAVINHNALGVIYSRGGDRHYECKRATFLRWIRVSAAERLPPGGRSA